VVLTMAQNKQRRPWLPPRWFVRLAWKVHRGIYAVTGGRKGLWKPKPGRWGALRLTTIGRRTKQPRSVIVGYFEDGPNLVVLAMNGWASPQPAWWLNLMADPHATVRIEGKTRPVRAHAAKDEERTRLWAEWSKIDKQLDQYAAKRSRPTEVVVLEPATAKAEGKDEHGGSSDMRRAGEPQ
jgi:deazaflavin-dependent oxidoreductase (nitroreductase family)